MKDSMNKVKISISLSGEVHRDLLAFVEQQELETPVSSVVDCALKKYLQGKVKVNYLKVAEEKLEKRFRK